MKDLVITWPTVALVLVLAGAFVALVKFAPPQVFAPGGVVFIAVAAALRQAAYKKPNGTVPPPPMPKDLP